MSTLNFADDQVLVVHNEDAVRYILQDTEEVYTESRLE